MSVPSEKAFSEQSWTATSKYPEYTRNVGHSNFGLESLLAESNIGHEQPESTEPANRTNVDSDLRAGALSTSQVSECLPQERVDIDDFQWLLGTVARGSLETEQISGMNGLNSANCLIRPLDMGQQMRTNVPDIWSYVSQLAQGVPFHSDCVAATRTLPRLFLRPCALSRGGSSDTTKAGGALVTVCSPRYSSTNRSAMGAHTTSTQQRQLHCYTEGPFHSCTGPGSGYEAPIVRQAHRYTSNSHTPSIIVSHKRRHRLTPTESEYLMTQFHLKERPTAQERDMFAKHLNLDRKTVQVWFQNRRAKLKREGGRLF